MCVFFVLQYVMVPGQSGAQLVIVWMWQRNDFSTYVVSTCALFDTAACCEHSSIAYYKCGSDPYSSRASSSSSYHVVS
jgi:hypothetical protein